MTPIDLKSASRETLDALAAMMTYPDPIALIDEIYFEIEIRDAPKGNVIRFPVEKRY